MLANDGESSLLTEDSETIRVVGAYNDDIRAKRNTPSGSVLRYQPFMVAGTDAASLEGHTDCIPDGRTYASHVSLKLNYSPKNYHPRTITLQTPSVYSQLNQNTFIPPV